MMRRFWIFAAVVPWLVLPNTGGAVGLAPELEITAPAPLARAADEVAHAGRGDFTAALELTGLAGFSAPIRIILATEESETARSTPSWISGFADGRTRTVVLFPGRVAGYPDDSMATLVQHEVAHVLVAEAARGRRVPRWFNEGIATVAAREWGIEDRARYALAVVGRSSRTTADLDAGFAAGGRRAVRSYALSSAFVRWLRAEYGRAVTARILDRLGNDMAFREAFVRSTGDTLERAEHRFFVREAIWHTWVPLLSSSGVLWFGITALALLAIQRRRAKSAAMRERWDAEERALDGGPSSTTSMRLLDFGRRTTLGDTDDDVVN